VYEPSSRDDVTFLGVTLLNAFAALDNVIPSFKFVGSSNGAAIVCPQGSRARAPRALRQGGSTLSGRAFCVAQVNRLIIENDDPRFTHAVTSVSQLNTHQYHDDGGRDNIHPSPDNGGSFYIRGSEDRHSPSFYATKKDALTRRFILASLGGRDGLIKPRGGRGVGLMFLDWQDSAYARAYGYTGAKLAATSPSSGMEMCGAWSQNAPSPTPAQMSPGCRCHLLL
jgi:hypothetical protein